MQKRLILVLAVSLGVSLLVIAFLAGRLTSSAPTIVEHESPPPLAAPSVAPEQAPAKVQDTERSSGPEIPVHEPLPRESLRPTAPPIQPAAPSPAPAITSYFAKIDAIQSAGSGDPTAFAQGIVGGIQAGDTSALDTLVNNAKIALAQARAVQPPPACAEFHRRLLESLSESIAGMDKIRTAFKKGDVGDLSALAMQFQAAQQKVDDLDRMRRQLLGQ